MPDKYITLLDFMITGLVTIVSYTTGVLSIVLMTSWLSLLGLIPTILASLYWIPRLKKDIKTYYNGSFWNWLKSIVKKN